GWLTEPRSNPRPGTTPTADLVQSPASRMRLRIAALRNGFLRKDPYHSSSNTHRMDVNDRCRTLRDRVSAVPRPGRTAGRRTAPEPATEGGAAGLVQADAVPAHLRRKGGRAAAHRQARHLRAGPGSRGDPDR